MNERRSAGRRVMRALVGIVVVLALGAVIVLALVQRFHLYPGLARLWE